jgi:RecA/RadA recombinase
MARKTLRNLDLSGSSDVKSAFLQALGAMEEEGHTVLKMDAEESFVPSGSIVVDHVLRLKGIPHGGRVVQIEGKEHGGKSTLCYSWVKHYQRFTDTPCVIFDFERTATAEYLSGLGLNIDKGMLSVQRPDSIEDAIKKALVFMKAGVRLFVFDSVPRMKTMVEEKDIMSGQAFKATVGEHARTMSKFFDIILPYAGKYDCCILMVNQIRARIESTQEALSAQKYPSITNLPYVLPGGNAMRFVPSLTIEVNVAKAFRAGGHDDDFVIEPGDNKGDYVATKVKIRILKNKATTGGYREFHLWLRPGLGLDDWISVRELARSYKLIFNKGKKWIVGTEQDPIAIYENKDEAVRDLVLEQNFTVLSALRNLVIQKIAEDHAGFMTEMSPVDKFLAGETDAIDAEVPTSVVKFDDEDEFS